MLMISHANRYATMSFSLPVHLLRQHLFCPRIPWFQELLDYKPPQPAWVRQGVAFHEHQQAVFRHRSLRRFGLEQANKTFHVSVQSEKLHLHGIIDCVLETQENLYPVEIKLAAGKPTPGHLAQVTAYGLLLADEMGKPCSLGFVVTGKQGKTWPVELTARQIESTLKLRDRICHHLEQGRMPDSAASEAQCTQCEYLNYCNDRT